MPGEKDFAISAVGGQHGVPSGAVYAGGQLAGSPISKKPCYLVTLDGVSVKTGKTVVLRFVAIDKPDFNTASFAQVKGFYCDSGEEEIVSNFQDIIRATPKETIMEIMFPTQKIHSIRSLVFNAEKPKSLVSK